MSQSLGFKNGYALPSRPRHAVGGEPLLINQLTEDALDELANTQPTLTYSSASKPAPVEFVPAHVAFDKKVQAGCHVGSFRAVSSSVTGAEI